MSWAITTGPRAQRRTRHSAQAHHASAAPAPRKKAAVVTPIVSRPELRLATSRTPRPASMTASTAVSAAATTRGGGAVRAAVGVTGTRPP